jgi:methyl-accepting chemotaxis protein
MSESTEELASKLQGVSEVLTETASFVEELKGQAGELAEEAAGHGWHGMSTRM